MARIVVLCPSASTSPPRAMQMASASEGAMLTELEPLWLIDQIYEGEVTGRAWVGLLQALAAAFRSDSGTIAIHSLPTGELRASAFVGIGPSYQTSYGALAARPDMQGVWKRMTASIPAEVVTDEITVPGSGFLRS